MSVKRRIEFNRRPFQNNGSSGYDPPLSRESSLLPSRTVSLIEEETSSEPNIHMREYRRDWLMRSAISHLPAAFSTVNRRDPLIDTLCGEIAFLRAKIDRLINDLFSPVPPQAKSN